MRVAVIGGGVVGLVVAGDLAARGVDTVCYERGDLGSGATTRAAGLCYDAFADPLDVAVADRAMARYRDWGLLDPCPYVWVGRTAADGEAISRQVERMQALGRAVDTLRPDGLAERWPALETASVVRAGIAHDAGLLDPRAVIDRLAARARAADVEIETDIECALAGPRLVETPTGTAAFDAVVVVAGPETGRLVEPVAGPLALKAYRAQVLQTTPVDASLPAFYDATEAFYWRPRATGLLVGDGAHEVDPADWSPAADAGFLDETRARLDEATALERQADVGVADAWTGLCTATPDRDPLVGRVGPGLWVGTGWQGHGLMRAPAMGEFVAASVTGTDHSIGADHRDLRDRLDPTRFDGTEPFDAVGDPTSDW